MGKLGKLTIAILLIVLIILNILVILSLYFIYNSNSTKNLSTLQKKSFDVSSSEEDDLGKHKGEFEVYQNDKYIKGFFYYDEAVSFASQYENASVKRRNGDEWLWDNTPQFNVYFEGDSAVKVFSSFSDAVSFAKSNTYADIYYRKNGRFIWNNHEKIKRRLVQEVPLIRQYPELKRGCEVTSLAMLLNYKGYNINKMELAEKIKKDTEPYRVENGKIYYGNPNNGFIGSIYDYNKKGLGVYHKPIYELLSSYDNKNSLDLTGCNFEDLYYFINRNSPVWVIINTKYKYLSPNNFQTWNTPDGEIQITYSEHSCLVVGYDDEFVYINDPMSDKSYEKKKKSEFIAAWEQMGKQAVTIY